MCLLNGDLKKTGKSPNAPSESACIHLVVSVPNEFDILNRSQMLQNDLMTVCAYSVENSLLHVYLIID